MDYNKLAEFDEGFFALTDEEAIEEYGPNLDVPNEEAACDIATLIFEEVGYPYEIELGKWLAEMEVDECEMDDGDRRRMAERQLIYKEYLQKISDFFSPKFAAMAAITYANEEGEFTSGSD